VACIAEQLSTFRAYVEIVSAEPVQGITRCALTAPRAVTVEDESFRDSQRCASSVIDQLRIVTVRAAQVSGHLRVPFACSNVRVVGRGGVTLVSNDRDVPMLLRKRSGRHIIRLPVTVVAHRVDAI
jgi:hypothetical protein